MGTPTDTHDRGTVLFLGYEAEGAGKIYLREERKAIQEGLARSSNGHGLHVADHSDLTIDQLPALIERERPLILHISSHGDPGGRLIVRAGAAYQAVETDALAKLILDCAAPPRLVVLNACFSAPLANKLRDGGLVVICTSERAPAALAARFAGLLYEQISQGVTLELAFSSAHMGITAHDRSVRNLYKLKEPANNPPSKITLVTVGDARDNLSADQAAKQGLPPHQLVILLDAFESSVTLAGLLPHIADYRERRELFLLSEEMRRLNVRRLRQEHPQPEDWQGLADAVQALVDKVRVCIPPDDAHPVEYFIGGKAPHAVYAHVGFILSSFSGQARSIRIIHHNNFSGPLVFDLTGQAPHGGQKFFDKEDGLDHDRPQPADGDLGFHTAPQGRDANDKILEYFRSEGRGRCGGVVSIRHTRPDPARNGQPTVMGPQDGPRAAHELIVTNHQISKVWPHRGDLHLFMDGPDFTGFLVGRAVNPRQSQNAKLHLTHYVGQRYVPAYTLPLAESRPPHVPQGPDAKLRRRDVFDAIKRGIELLRKTITRDDLVPPRGFTAGGETMSDRLLKQLGGLTLDDKPEGEVFELSVGRREMKIGEGICHALRDLDAPTLERFGRLLTLHELAHQPQRLLGTNYQGVGRAGVVLEDIDYWADAFALLSVTRWEVRDLGARGARDAGRILEQNIRAHLLGMAAFDRMEQGDSLARLPERRLRRYLLWSLQRARAEQVHSAAALEQLFEHRLVVELAPLAGRLDANGDKLVVHEQGDPQLFVALGGVLLRKPKLAESFVPARLVGLTRSLQLDALRDHLRAVVEEHAAVLTAWGDS